MSDTGTARPLLALLQTRLRRLLQERGVVVWYDEAGAFRNALDALDLGNVRRFVFDGSYYGLRAAIEPHFAALPRPTEPPLLVYVPAAPLDRRQDILREVAAAGGVFVDTLSSLARPALHAAGVPAETVDHWLTRSALTLEDLEQLAAAGTERDAALALVFGGTTPLEVAVELLTDPACLGRLAARDAVGDVRRFLRERFGFAAEADDVPALRDTFLRYVLLSEFLAGLRGGVPGALERAPHAAGAQASLCRQVAVRLRETVTLADLYARGAAAIQDRLGLAELGLGADDLGDAETFPFQDQALLDALAGMVESGDLAAAQQSVARHRRSFWARTVPGRQVQWQAAGMALDLIAAAGEVSREVGTAPLDPAALIRRYAGADAAPGWSRLDRVQRELETLTAGMEEEVRLPALLRRARQAYHDAAGCLADRFLDAIREHGFAFPGVAAQTDTFARTVAPKLALGKVAYLLVDALRYEMAAALAEGLPDRVLASALTPAVGVAPSITPLGMAALLPGADGGIAIVAKGKSVTAQVGGETFAGSAERTHYLQARLAEPAIDVTLGDLLGDKISAADLARARLCVVRSQELDQAGENVAASMAAGAIGPLLPQLKRAIAKLADHGFGEAVITADHGFLLLHDLPEAQKVDPPGGDEVLLHRRCWIGHGGTSSAAFVRFRAADLGMGGDLELAFPRGVAAFKAPGSAEYLHGGLSPQELVIPVLALTLRSAAGPQHQRVYIQPVGTVTNQMFYVRVRWQPGLIGSADRLRVRLAITPKRLNARILLADEGFTPGSDEVTLTPGRETTITVQLQAQAERGKLAVQVLDADTGRELAAEKEINYDITHSLLF